MAVVLMGHGPGTGNLGGNDVPDVDETRAEQRRFFAYSGPFTIDPEAGTITHRIEACMAAEWVGTDRVRRFEFLSDDRIALRPLEGSSELIWQRER
jgi:hypothetical protein